MSFLNMEPDHMTEFLTLSEKARSLLRDVPERKGFFEVFSIWSYPSFVPSFRWTVYSPWLPNGDEKAIASHTVWQMNMDAEKFRNPVERLLHPRILEPTIEEEKFVL